MMLEGKVGVVTGATAGLGRSAAFAMAREGAAVVVTGRDPAEGNPMVAKICELGGRAVFETVDVIDEAANARMVARALDVYGRLDIAYNNAGIESPACPVQNVNLSEVKAAYDVNLFSILTCMKHEIPAMLASGGGSIVNATSVWGLNAGPERSTYIAAKHAISGLTKTTALELATQNIRVNAIAPGPFPSWMLSAGVGFGGKVEGADWDAVGRNNPSGRVGTMEDIAGLAIFLSSRAGAYTVGETITCDGGAVAAS